MKTVYWGIGSGSCGRMRPESIGLGQMEDHIFGRKKGTTFCQDYHPCNIMKVVCLSTFLTVWSVTESGEVFLIKWMASTALSSLQLVVWWIMVSGWYADNIMSKIPVSLVRAFQKCNMKSLSLLETKLFGRPFSQYQLSKMISAISSAEESVLVGMRW